MSTTHNIQANTLCSIRCNSDDGITSPIFSFNLPTELSSVGVSAEQWQAFLVGANENVSFQWGKFCLYSLGPLCFFCQFLDNLHNRQVKESMELFCQQANAEKALGNVTVSSCWETQRQIVDQGATTESYHHIFFHYNQQIRPSHSPLESSVGGTNANVPARRLSLI